MKTKNSSEISEQLLNQTFWDLESPTEKFEPSELILFIKDTAYRGDVKNKLSLIIISQRDGYVVNNNFPFNSLEINERKYTFYYIAPNEKRYEICYWLKKN